MNTKVAKHHDNTTDGLVAKAVAEIKQHHDAILEPAMARVGELEEKVGILQDAVADAAKNAGFTGSEELPPNVKSSIEQQIASQLELMTKSIQEKLDKLNLAAAKNDATEERAHKGIAQRLHDHPEFQAAMQRADGDVRRLRGSTIVVRGEEFNPLRFPIHSYKAYDRYQIKADPVMGYAELGPWGVPFHRMDLATLLTEQSDIISMIPRVGVAGADKYDFPRETEESRLGYVATTLTANIIATDTTCTVDSTRGFTDDTTARFHTAAGIVTWLIEVVDATTLRFLDGPGGAPAQFGTTATAGETVTSENFAAVAEGSLKHVGVFKIERPSIDLKKFPVALIVTNQRLENMGTLQREMESRMVMRARRNASFHLLYGDDTDPKQAAGFASDPDVMTYLWSNGTAGDTRADAVLRATQEIHTTNPIWVVMNKRDWTTLMTVKSTSDDHYLMNKQGPVVLTNLPLQKAVGEHPVMFDAAVRLGDFFTIDWLTASEWVDREDTTMALGFIDQQFLENTVTILLEQSWNHPILSPLGYSFNQWDSQP